ncbi:conserved hypothetical protein [Streptomyces sviceus ATCC 29083]|uniref:Uncharacterized protein n=1 Tax=Streptomyces sviceus (strain ATCC 29083 / DSM 924 / JCM 4929 / NBRC 13980 / NCIMB 11184 / NRRL 5439 / UC 5370) TaxID=463191 RepID=B5HN03_STRX2|nr:conserved hypothetical protein [Streptomyces sviceus ATCC 29083]
MPGRALRPGIDVQEQAFLTDRAGAITRKRGNGSLRGWAYARFLSADTQSISLS